MLWSAFNHILTSNVCIYDDGNPLPELTTSIIRQPFAGRLRVASWTFLVSADADRSGYAFMHGVTDAIARRSSTTLARFHLRRMYPVTSWPRQASSLHSRCPSFRSRRQKFKANRYSWTGVEMLPRKITFLSLSLCVFNSLNQNLLFVADHK